MKFGKPKPTDLSGAIQAQDWKDVQARLTKGEAFGPEEFRLLVALAPPETVQVAIAAGADLRGTATERHEPPLVTATVSRRVDLIDLLVERGADLGQTDATGVSPMMAAAYLGLMQPLISLCRLGGDTEQADPEGFTPLMWAANAGKTDCVKVLLMAEANPNARDRQNNTPAMFAAQGGHLDCLQVLVQAGADLNAVGTHGLSPLGFAKQNRHQSTAEWIENHLK